MTDKKNYNLLADQGIDDIEYVEMYGLDPSLAYTDRLNGAVLEKVYEENLVAETEGFISEGYSPEEAAKRATHIAKSMKQKAMTAAKQVQKQRGY